MNKKQNWDLILKHASEIIGLYSDEDVLAGVLGVSRRQLTYYMAKFARPKKTESIFEAFKRRACDSTLDLSNPLPLEDSNCVWCGKVLSSLRHDRRFCGPTCSAKWKHSRGPSRPYWNAWNEHIFDEPTANGAYILGFIVADGYVRDWVHKKRGTRDHTIVIHQKDPDILCRIALALEFQGKIDDGDNAKGLRLGSKHAWGLVTGKYQIPAGGQKSSTARIPPVILENGSVLPHFIRGLFDGDGYISKNGYQFGLSSGSNGLMDDFVSVLVNEVGLPRRERTWVKGGFEKKDGTQSGNWFVRWTAPYDSMRFAHYIYGSELNVYGGDLFLRRKKERFDQLFVPWHDKDWLFQKFVVEGKSPGKIASGFPDASATGVGHWISHYGLRQARSKYWNLELGI